MSKISNLKVFSVLCAMLYGALSSVYGQSYEAEVGSTVANVPIVFECDSRYSNGQSVRVVSTAVGNYCEWALPSVATGTYNITYYYKSLDVRCMAQASIDGVNQGPVIDMYSPTEAYQVIANVGNKTFVTPGVKRFKLTVTGKHSASTGYSMQIDKIVLTLQASIGGTWMRDTSSAAIVLTNNTDKVGVGVPTVGTDYKMQIDDGATLASFPTVQIGQTWVYGKKPWYMLGLYNKQTSGGEGSECILNLNAAVGQAGIELSRGGDQKWYIYNTAGVDGAVGADRLDFYNTTTRMCVLRTGEVGINTTDPKQMLDVNGNIKCLKLFINNWSIEAPDYVFESEYKLRSLAEVEAYIKENRHLPEVPSAVDIKRDGVEIQEMNMTLLKKVEELTLYAIEQGKKIEQLQQKFEQVR